MSEYRGSLLEILTIALAGASLVIVILRAVARHRIARVCESTDILLPLALVILLSQSVFVRLAISNGLGRHASTLSENEIITFQKFIYASNLLFQLLLSLCQVVILLLIKSVEPQRPIRVGCNIVLTFIGVYSLGSLTVLAFQCSLPEPWLVITSKCLNRQLLLTIFKLTNITIDFVTLILPIVMICRLKTTRDKKVFLCILFGARVSLPLITIPQLWKIPTLLSLDDMTWDMVPFQTWNQVIMNVSMITACLPSFGRMMWELWALGSGLRATRCSKDVEGRDFGHELGLENGSGQPKEKAQSETMIQVEVRRVNSFDSGASIVVARQKNLPALPRRTTSRFRPVRKQDHHYRRPISSEPILANPEYLPSMHFAALGMPSPNTISHRCQLEEAINKQPDFPFPSQALVATHRHHNESLPPYARSTPPLHQLPTLPRISDSFDDEDASSIDIDSYYLMNNNAPYDTSRTELVLQSMIDELKSQNNSIYSCPHRGGSSIYSEKRLQSSVYSACNRNDGGWI